MASLLNGTIYSIFACDLFSRNVETNILNGITFKRKWNNVFHIRMRFVQRKSRNKYFLFLLMHRYRFFFFVKMFRQIPRTRMNTFSFLSVQLEPNIIVLKNFCCFLGKGNFVWLKINMNIWRGIEPCEVWDPQLVFSLK